MQSWAYISPRDILILLPFVGLLCITLDNICIALYNEHIKTQYSDLKQKVIIMTTSTTVKYVMTNGLNVTSDKYAKPFLAKVVFAIQDNGTVIVTVESGRNGSQMKKLGTKVISRQELRDMPENDYDNMVFNRAAFAMFDCTV